MNNDYGKKCDMSSMKMADGGPVYDGTDADTRVSVYFKKMKELKAANEAVNEAQRESRRSTPTDSMPESNPVSPRETASMMEANMPPESDTSSADDDKAREDARIDRASVRITEKSPKKKVTVKKVSVSTFPPAPKGVLSGVASGVSMGDAARQLRAREASAPVVSAQRPSTYGSNTGGFYKTAYENDPVVAAFKRQAQQLNTYDAERARINAMPGRAGMADGGPVKSCDYGKRRR